MKYINANELLMFLKPPVTRLSVFVAETVDAALIMCAEAFPKMEEEFKTTIDFPTFKFQLLKTMSEFIETCREQNEVSLENPREHMEEARYQRAHIDVALWPKHLQKKVGENFFIIAYCTAYGDILFRYLMDADIPAQTAQQLASQSVFAMAKWIDENCIKKCNYECIRRNKSNGYCALCTFMIQPLPCPKKQQISFERIGIVAEEMNCKREDTVVDKVMN